MLRLVLAAGWLLQPLAGPLLRRRLARGKEDPLRLCEKLGQPRAARPHGPLIWLHGVGVGEVMALRGLIASLSDARPDLHFLVTSSARSSGDVFAANLPTRTIHHYLPLDLPRPVARFLDHWRPDLAIWSDQEVWPRLAATCARRGIHQAYVAARITDASAKARARFGRAYGDLYGLMDVIHAQDTGTAQRLEGLMQGGDVHVSGSLKAAAAPLADAPDLRAKLPQGRRVWVAAPAHPADARIALDTQRGLMGEGGTDLLILAPRRMEDADGFAAHCRDMGLTACRRSRDEWPDETTAVFIADSFGELGVWYRAARAALIGGTFDATEGHNPWEAVALGCAIFHGPRTANFATDYKMLDNAGAALQVTNPKDLITALQTSDVSQQADRAASIRTQAATGLQQITDDLLRLLAR
ncbi:3-deoxy-D-manno-octulosonic acid transferase [Pseudooctadecabacter jejudonensis]|uniref:3-deoxy-D-manno-octulosonic acid transferase n=2 Tax=Pseudooctadecabacter jejudonensis TaxID=1391910 RepID=A0A1Y5SL95_9RHOB|nr:3-deoxy-D-manno-octulosonic acid transferase [Pseudooctadecabacter jejudonensis]